LKSKYYLILFSIIFLFFSVVLHLNVSPVNPYQDIDSKAYIHPALNFYENNSFSDGSIPYYCLGYAFFVGFLYKIFVPSNSFVTWVQVLIALLTGFLIFFIARRLFNEKIALISFVIFTFNVGFLTFNQFILTEILLTFLLTLFLYLFIIFLSDNKLIYLFLSGLSLGLSIVVKPAAIYFILFIVLFLAIFLDNTCLQKLKFIILFCFAFYLPVFGYMYFNKVNYNEFRIAALGNENLYFYLFPKVLASKNKTDVKQETQKLASMLTGNKMASSSWISIKQLFIQNLQENPILFIKIWLQNVSKTFLGLYSCNLKVLVEPNTRGGDISFFKNSGNLIARSWIYIIAGTTSFSVKLISFLEAIWTILRYILCFIALMFLLIRKKWSLLFLLAGYIFYFSMITGHDGCARFRMMFEPVLIILSALGFWVILERVGICKIDIS